MPSVSSAFAEYLQSDALYAADVAAAVKAAFGDRAIESTVLSPYRWATEAAAEADRQQSFLGAPHVQESVRVAGKGLIEAYRGRCVTIIAAEPGYEAPGTLVFVLGGDELRDQGITILDVLRRL